MQNERAYTIRCPNCTLDFTLNLPVQLKDISFSTTCPRCNANFPVYIPSDTQPGATQPYQRPPAPSSAPMYTPYQQPSPYPPPYYMQPSPPPPPQPPPNAYSWEIFPHLAYELKEPQKANVTYMFMIIGVILVVMALIGFIASFSIIVMAQSSEGVDFGSDIRLIGVVKSESGENLSGVVVSIQGTDLSAVTNHRGQYSIRNAPGGIWRIKASLQGYKNSTQKVLLVRDISDQVDFELKEGSGDVETNSVGFLYAFSIVTLFFSVFILAGAYFCFNGTRFSVVLVSSILGCCSSLIIAGVVALGTLDPWYAIGILLALFSFLLVIAYRKEFKTHEDAENE